jgi:PhnB protein
LQLGLFSEMPDSLGAQFLAATLDELTDASLGPDLLLRTWQTGDVAGMEKVLRDFRMRYPEAYLRLIANRNHAWMPKLLALINGPSTQLVIAGTAHWVGPDGIIGELKTRGYEVRPVAASAVVSASTPGAPAAPRDPRTAGAPWTMTFLYCRDPAMALAFYRKAFGFSQGISTFDKQGRLSYAEVKYQDAVIMLGGESPAQGRYAPVSLKSAPSSQLYIYIADLDAFVAKAVAAGAEVIEQPTDRSWGERTALLRDPEGYLWMFAMRIGAGSEGRQKQPQ